MRILPFTIHVSRVSSGWSGLHLAYLVRGSVPDSLPPWLPGDCLGERTVPLAVELALPIQVHDVDLDQAVWGPAPDAKVKPRPAKMNQL